MDDLVRARPLTLSLLLEQFGQLGSYVASGLLSSLDVPANCCPLPYAPCRLARRWNWPQDASDLKSAVSGVVYVGKTEEPTPDIVKAVVGARVDRDRRVLT